jgi:hypothetical protein
VIQGPATVTEGSEGIGEPLFPVLVGGAGADGVLDGGGRAGAVGHGVDLLLVALAGVVPALDHFKLAGAGLARNGASIGRFPLSCAGIRACIGIAAMAGIAAVTWTARPGPLSREEMTGMRDATAASTAWDRAQSRSRDSISARTLAKTGPGIGMVQPVRCASTDSSAHKVIRGSPVAAR